MLSSFESDRFIHARIAAQAARTPDAVALTFATEQLTYRELDERTTRIAARLQAQGIGGESLVAVSMLRSLELVVALVGILKAGAAYVPLDPGYPLERLRYMIDDAAATLVLDREHVESWQREASGTGWTAPQLTGANLAYVIYTSGSTGQPKGAMNTHAAIANRLEWMQAAYPLAPGDVVLQKTPFSFDVSVWELFWPLMMGARLVIAEPDAHKDPVYLCEVIKREGVTTLHFVPSMLSVFLECSEAARCTSIRDVVASGEALPLALAQRCHARMPWVALHNLYGPTEAAVDVSAYTCRWGDEASIPIGTEITGVQLHVLDANLARVANDVTGELYIGGIAVGRGYWRRPELTASRYVPDPYGPPGSRLYRTGDLVVRRSDGEIEYLGRLDHQVKLRGFRIELGEIEETLRAHKSVQDAVVLVDDTHTDDKRLVAYVAAASAPNLDDMRARLRAKLPEYMVPSAIMVLEAFPLTPNGKLDRAALLRQSPSPAPSTSPPDEGDDVEREIAQMSRDVLRVHRIGLDDNFFELGGHSLLLTQLVTRIERELGVEVSLRHLFDAPTVRGVAAIVRERLAEIERLIEGMSPEEVEALLGNEGSS